MSKRLQNIQVKSLVAGAAAVLALILTMPVAPASAQGVPAGLLRLDSSQPSEYGFGGQQLSADEQTKVRSAYARVNKKKHPTH